MPAQERFVILAREETSATAGLQAILSRLGEVEVIVDRPGSAAIWYSDEEVAGYEGLMSSSGNFPATTAWSRALFHLEATLVDDQAIWFVEDDVAGSAEAFTRLVQMTAADNADFSALDLRFKSQDTSWPHWRYAAGWFTEPGRSFNPLCRLRAPLLKKILKLRAEHGCFTFHEILFYSTAKRYGMRSLNWREEPRYQSLFPAFRWRPEVKECLIGICHPVKTLGIHRQITGIQAP